jgi:MoxR-like ATPase
MTAWPPELPDPFDPAQSRTATRSEAAVPWTPPPEEPSLSREDIEQSAEHFRARVDLLKEEIQRAIVAQDDIIEHIITAMIAGGHVLLDTEPGLGKTVLARAAANALSLQFQRVQFTPDFGPADLVGTNLLVGSSRPNRDDAHFEFIPGPIFCHFLLGDQIDCAPVKTQATLFEAMQDRSVNVAGQTRLLGEPFFVLATRNTSEKGDNALTPAQLDRFFFSLTMPFPSLDEFDAILERTAEAPLPVRPDALSSGWVIEEILHNSFQELWRSWER